MTAENVAALVVRVNDDGQAALPRVIEAVRAVNPDIEVHGR